MPLDRAKLIQSWWFDAPKALLSIVAVAVSWPAMAQTPTSTSLSITSGGNVVSTVTAGTLVTLTASVVAGATPVTQGQVIFCNGNAEHCTDVNLLGTGQLTSAGTAKLSVRPLPGIYNYRVEFMGTPAALPAYTGSVSLITSFVVTGLIPTATTITLSGASGNYTLTATVGGFTKSSSVGAPTGMVSFRDSTTGNSLLASPTLAAGNGPMWINSSSPAVGNEPGGIVAADFNRDGNLDLAVGLNEDTNSVAILLGDGRGNFSLAPSTSLSGLWKPVATADFNQDGIPDLVVWNQSNLMVLLGNGDGTFTQANGNPLSVAAGFGNLFPIVVADLNGDGIPDLAIANSVFQLTVFLGNGDGTFAPAPPSSFNSELSVVSMVVGDLNGDGIPDVAILDDSFSLSVSVYFGNGDGTFSPGPSTPVGPSAADLPLTFAAGDFNGDGKLDLAVPNEGSSSLAILLGNGDGTFQLATGSPIPLGSFPNFAAVGEFNGDGVPDLLVGQMTSGMDVFVLLGNGDGTFTQIPTGPLSLPCCATTVLGDLNGDGITDIASVDFYQGVTDIFLTTLLQSTATANGVAVSGAQSPQLVLASYAGDSSFASSTSASTSLIVQATTPLFTPASGTPLAPSQSITLASATPDATIYYQASGVIQTSGYLPYEGPIVIPGLGNLTIQAYATANNYGQSATSSATFTVTTANAAPVLNSMSPAFTTAGSVGFTITITGSGFIAGSTAYWDTTALATQYVSVTQLTAQVTSAEAASAGITPIIVQPPAPIAGSSNALQFEVDSGGAGTAPAFATSTATVTAGSSASYALTLPASATDVTVSCLNLPPGASCSYSAAAGALAIATSNSTPSGTYQITVVFNETLPGSASALVLLLLLLPLVFRGKWRKQHVWALTALTLVLSALAMSSCGGGSGGAPPPPPATHQVTSSGSVTLTVQ